MNDDRDDVFVSEEELSATDGVSLPREVRREILTRFKRGETVSQICDVMQLKRHKVRSMVDPSYRNPHQKAKKMAAEVLEAAKTPDDEKKHTFTQRALLNEAQKGEGIDTTATADLCLDDLRKVAKELFPKYPTRWDYYLYGRYNEVTWNQFFGNFEQYAAAAGLRPTRTQKEMERHVAKHSSLDGRRNFYREEVKPYVGQYPRTLLKPDDLMIATVSDIHDIEADPFAWAVFLDTVHRLQPEKIGVLGDAADEYEFSRFTQDPRLVDVAARRTFLKNDVFGALRAAAPNAEIQYLLGNHEWRLLKMMSDKSPNIKPLLDWMGISLEDVFGVHEFEINVYCKWDFAAFHKRDVKDQLRQNYIIWEDALVGCHFPDEGFRFGRSWVAGHTHRPRQVIKNTLDGTLIGTTMGSIARVNADYVEGFDQAANGFALHHIHPRSRAVLSENIIIPANAPFAAVAGKYYHRV